jgi:CheY-like chemotaxis protein
MLKVMLIEDDPEFIYLIQRYARASGCQFIQQDSTGQVISAAERELPDLVLLDLAPNESSERCGPSWQMLRTLKTNPRTRKLPVFVCLASELATNEWAEYAEGCLLKPVMYEDFKAALTAATPQLRSFSDDKEAPGK